MLGRIGVDLILSIRDHHDKSSSITPTPSKKRKNVLTNPTIRKYRPRKIQWNASAVEELINLDVETSNPPLTESPLTLNQPEDVIRSYIDRPFVPPHYECISQFVERAVKDTSESVPMVTGVDRQDGLTLNKKQSRAEYPSIRKRAQ